MTNSDPTAETWRAEGAALDIDPARRGTIEVLVVDDERTLRESCASLLRAEGFSVAVAGDGREALQLLSRIKPDIVLVDLYLADVPGTEILERALELDPRCLVIVMTGKPSVHSSIEVLRAGAWNYLPKPFSALHLRILMGRAAHAVIVTRESGRREEREEREERPERVPDVAESAEEASLLGESGAFRRVIEAARQVARTDATVFLSGESGTGKELVARFIHRHSRRRSREMIPLNCAAVPEGLLESEMFGHVEGAFTGAVREKKGLLEAANGGTLFLDEINGMPRTVQAKLLRVVQDGVVRKVGSVFVDAVVDVRFIAATNVDPEEAAASGRLRRDLLYRLHVFPIHIPPLRERPEDVELLAHHFMRKFWRMHREGDGPVPALSDAAVAALQRWPWYGNVRELRNLLEHTAVILPDGAKTVEPDILPFRGRQGWEDGARKWLGAYFNEEYHSARKKLLAEFERRYLEHVVRQVKGNVSDAAREAGVDRATLYRLMVKHDIRKEDLLTDKRD